MQRERVASRGGLRGYGNCYAMLDQAKKNLTPTTRDGEEEEGWGVTCVLFFLTNKIQKLYAVGCQDLANGQQHKKGTEDKGGGGQGMLRVIRIRWRIPCGDTEYLTSAWKRKRKPNGASVAQFNLFPARLQPTQRLSRSGSPPANHLFPPPIRTIFKYTNLSFHKNAQLQLNSARQRKFVVFAASKFISPYKFMHYGETSFRK